jgi:hypothetical protein
MPILCDAVTADGRECPIKRDCYRYTCPIRFRDRFGSAPYDFAAGKCDHFHDNRPTEEHIRTSAYFLWLGAGKPEGRAEEFWLRARRTAEEGTGRIPPASR